MIDYDNLDPEALYVIHSAYSDDIEYARTPDGVGCYWYDDRDEAMGDVCEVRYVKHFDSFQEWEDYRYRETNV